MRALLNPWNPWQELDQIQHEMGRLFGRRMGNASPRPAFPAVNVWGDESSLVLTAEIPGVDPEKLDITVNRNTIVLGGTREVRRPQGRGDVLSAGTAGGRVLANLRSAFRYRPRNRGGHL